jgi:hypothetical protein
LTVNDFASEPYVGKNRSSHPVSFVLLLTAHFPLHTPTLFEKI